MVVESTLPKGGGRYGRYTFHLIDTLLEEGTIRIEYVVVSRESEFRHRID